MLIRCCLIFFASVLLAQAPSPFDVPNKFAEAYNVWAGYYRERVQGLGDGGIDAREIHAWKQVRSDFKDLQKYLDSVY